MIGLSGNSVFLNGEAKPLPSAVPIISKASNVTPIGGYETNVDTASVGGATAPEWQMIGEPLEVERLLEPDMVPAVERVARLGDPLADPSDLDFLLPPFLEVKQGHWLAAVDNPPANIVPNSIPHHACAFVQPQRPETIPDNWDLATELKATPRSTIAPNGADIDKGFPLGTGPALTQPQEEEEPSRSTAAGKVGGDGKHAAEAGFPAANGPSDVEQDTAGVTMHEVLTSLQKPLLSVRERLCSAAIEASAMPSKWLWIGGRKARLWDEYCRVFDDVISDIENEMIRSFGADFGPSRRVGNNLPEKEPVAVKVQRNRSRVD
ncbi:hypothetical protein HJC06_30285 [Rhizobium sp. NLR9b]|uniref:hypothetical protein n=1 Tax=unclassified Rhizobium TaxID=2613769 RepID=UPI001C83D632|nr:MULTISPECIES: hypothetical protein [unclassified Rhizobium]MBX5230632.1 hypothetical protein [Rhizobium sp. NLR9b]MBX5291300.1 hypothetical protein [Rhizobium sp. NLR10b]